MPDQSANEVITQQHHRSFIQWEGARPNSKPAYQGQDAQYMTIGGVGAPVLGGTDPIWVPDPRRAKAFKLVGRSVSPADLPSATLTFREKHGKLPRHLGNLTCPFNVYELIGRCRDLSDFTNGWES